MKNREFARLLNQVADILEIKEVQWKPQAYRKAARAIESMNRDIEDIYKEEGRKGLDNIPGVGESIAMHIEEFLKTGRVGKFDRLLKEIPKGTSELMELQGLGPKKVKRLSRELGIKNIEGLKKALKEHKIRELEGFGEKTEEELMKSLKMYRGSKTRMLLGKALPIAEELIAYLRKNCPVGKIVYAGSLRRMKETIGDIDILVTSSKPKRVMEVFTGMDQVARVLSSGETRSSVVLRDGIQVDVRVLPIEKFGSALQYFTGNKDHNIELRKEAIKQDYKLSEYGLFSKKTGKLIPCEDEETIYRKLGFAYIPPELRENRGELEAARKGKLPALIEQKDMRGDLQMHTRASDGQDTVLDMAAAAEKMGYEYIAITDHSQSTRIARGLDEKRVREQWKEIDKVSRNSRICILKGAEVEIRPDGSLDFPDRVLRELDVVVAAIHSRFKSPEKEMTERIVKALESGFVNIFAHPTGRIIGKREPYAVNMEKLCQAARDNGVALEINSDPERLDLNDSAVIYAKDFGVKFSINTDAHIAPALANIKYGIAQARRGWLEKKDVINTFPLKKLRKELGK